ncbi:DNA adenine methylase [Corynebacterium halotolerans]|uniref:site-specific DNA-methyltransferase (adenine-specific) n=1 Tax=Corynebacterium halotolerans YIM 70093 = DSM 44683 TaxID=1121362 RepID=M1P065_9CORY|nr:Dam family site-specific DNA-(adenine-N6)-methyltransferase [Corynebacterium halotolerans]AGF73165.1 type IIs modification methyltransferase [Corynebacterium halotolerans YIM 70093 = DSM 44683]
MKPVLKWAGGKTQLLPHLRPFFNPEKRYIEPFLGGGALLFDLMPEAAVVNDSNRELMATYRAIREEPDAVFEAVQSHRNEKEYFLELRAVDPETLDPVALAGRMIFLNKTCFNGLYRVNRQNRFNVPFGNYRRPSLPGLEYLRELSAFLQRVEIHDGDYRDFLRKVVRPGDQVFLDPPYDPISRYSDFTRYTPAKFFADDQSEVAELARELSERGVFVVITNSDTELIRSLYEGFRIHEVAVRRAINKDPEKRGGSELIMVGQAA